jgi:hypothetical protein
MKTNAQSRRRLPHHVAEAIAAILDYLWEDEMRDYLTQPRTKQDTHIFNELLSLRKWLRDYDARRGEKQ